MLEHPVHHYMGVNQDIFLGGMLVQKLNVNDLQFEKMSPFDGTMAYAQNKRQQIIMAEKYAAAEPSINFSTMHPGWSDTPAVKNSMPDFHAKMQVIKLSKH